MGRIMNIYMWTKCMARRKNKNLTIGQFSMNLESIFTQHFYAHKSKLNFKTFFTEK